MLVYAFMLMLIMYFSAEKIYLKFISTKDGTCDILVLSSPCDGCLKYFYDMLQSIDIETVKKIKNY
ncbi:hypothetical protein THOM_2133 [Trachipleistophora hominis]|uniref:Transposable element encoded protein n=1 Tax=Trachipleistophora hominis TaxID=72359 RepID=L7JU47_TRAHO|nr:hypothetical protein THOM_2133 [Trachipleistophora hominis]